jgi:hypothetical protein
MTTLYQHHELIEEMAYSSLLRCWKRCDAAQRMHESIINFKQDSYL